MKRKSFSFNDWPCITQKRIIQQPGNAIDGSSGWFCLLLMEKVSDKQSWTFGGQEIMICDKGIKWLSFLSKEGHYVLTALFDKWEHLVLWYIDMIGKWEVNQEGEIVFEDLYLDLVVYPDGRMVEDDRDELEAAFLQGVITSGQYEQARRTCDKLKKELSKEGVKLIDWTMDNVRQMSDKLDKQSLR